MNDSEERKVLREWLVEDFGEDSDVLMGLCCDKTTGRPLYFSHISLALESIGKTLPLPYRQLTERAYIYLTAVYYLADAISDGHPCHGCELDLAEMVSLLAILEARSASHFANSCPDPSLATRAISLFYAGLAVNRSAIKAEKRSRSIPVVEWEAELFHQWGRSNSFLSLLDHVALITGSCLSNELRWLVQNLLALIQRGDDVCDWREDLSAGYWTPFLRQCVQSRPPDAFTAEAVEEIVYLEGMMESELSQISQELLAVKRAFSLHTFGDPLAEFSGTHQVRVADKLHVMTHLSAIQDLNSQSKTLDGGNR